MTLDELALKYDTDKSSRSHFYTRHYERIFGSIRNEVQALCEVGIAAGASLKMWRDYFQSAIIFGVDQTHCDDIGDRIVTYECDQENCEALNSHFQDKKLEIIVDDASHNQESTIKTLDCLWTMLERKGWYVIEDMDRSSFIEMIGRWYQQRPNEIRQFQILNNHDGGSSIIFIQKQ